VLRGRRRGDKIIISVTDTGNGIDKDTLDYLFQPLAHTNPEGKFQPTKVSLGLQISKIILTRIGGELRVSTKPGKGTSATIIAPRKYTDIPLKIPLHVGKTSAQLD
jgi:signal transduction histidine kinase